MTPVNKGYVRVRVRLKVVAELRTKLAHTLRLGADDAELARQDRHERTRLAYGAVVKNDAFGDIGISC